MNRLPVLDPYYGVMSLTDQQVMDARGNIDGLVLPVDPLAPYGPRVCCRLRHVGTASGELPVIEIIAGEPSRCPRDVYDPAERV